MSRSRAKRLPRLWCALQGLLPLEACLAAQRGELAWPREFSGEACGRPLAKGRDATDEKIAERKMRK